MTFLNIVKSKIIIVSLIVLIISWLFTYINFFERYIFIILLPIFISLIILICYPLFKFFEERVHWYKWDYGIPFYGLILSFIVTLLMGSGGGASNFLVEIFLVSLAGIIAICLRLIFPGRTKMASLLSSIFAVSIPIIALVFIRLTMPSLPD